MKTKLCLAAILLVSTAFLTACRSGADFFPISVGSRWEYLVTTTQYEPKFAELLVSLGTDGLVFQYMRNRCPGYSLTAAPSTYKLVLEVEREFKHLNLPFPLEHSRGYRIKVLEDELGLYSCVDRLYWVVDRQSYKVFEIKVYRNRDIGNNFLGIGEWGYAVAPIFYKNASVDQVALSSRKEFAFHFPGRDPVEGITALSCSNRGKEEVACLRMVLPEEMFVEAIADEDAFADRFLANTVTERRYYRKGEGLVEFRQLAGSNLTMKWELIDFTQPE